jgi:integrase
VVRTFEWTPALRVAVDLALAARPIDLAPWLFCTKYGEGYFNEQTGQATGWDSMWQRFMARLLAETKITHRFTEHDLRAKCASDAESLQRARQLLGHADAQITARVYRRKPEIVRPLR